MIAWSRPCARVLLALLASVLAPAQDQEVSGRVVNDHGDKIAGAEVTFLPLPVEARPRTGSKGRYQLAQAMHRTATKLPRTRTDRDGAFRCLLSPQLAALAAGSGVELAMRVTAPGHVAWMRAIGERLEGADGVVAVLPQKAANAAARLRLRIASAVDGSYRGFALIERAYRARPDRSVWLRQLVPVSTTGEVTYDEPCRVPGEVAASLPTARAEGYRVTLLVAGLDRWQHTLGEGAHEVRPERSDLPARRVLADRSEPARTPIEATYMLAGEEVTLRFDAPRVPLLGGEAPVRVSSASGPVTVDAWDPDVPLFVDTDAAQPTKNATEATPAPAATRAIDLAIVDRRKQPLFGAAVWVEDSAARLMLPAGKPFGVSDPQGLVHLGQLPPGMHYVLVRHATGGEREVLLDTTQTGPVQVVLREPPAFAAAAEVQPASILLDLGPPADAKADPQADPDVQLDVGVLQVGGRMLRRGFAEHVRWIRLEGLTPGPATVWARVGNGPVHFVGGTLATADEEPAVHPLRASSKTFVLDVRTHQGTRAEGVYVSLGDAAPKGKKPYTADLLPLAVDPQSGRASLTVRVLGDLWVVVHGAAGERRDLLLQTEGNAPVLDVTLPPPPADPKAAASEGAADKGAESGKKDDGG